MIIKDEFFQTYGINYDLKINSDYCDELKKMFPHNKFINVHSVRTGQCVIVFNYNMFFASIQLNASSRYEDIYNALNKDQHCTVCLSLFLDPERKIENIKHKERIKEGNKNFNRFEYLDFSD